MRPATGNGAGAAGDAETAGEMASPARAMVSERVQQAGIGWAL